eukprot:COSAG06_NODE_610_length_13844_cov_14.456359_4_plen_340_part_00
MALLAAALRWQSPAVALLHMQQLGWLGLAGCFLLAGQSFCIVTALRLTTVANVALLVNTSPAFTATLDYFFLEEPLPLRTKLMILSGLLSVGIILGSDVAFAKDNLGGNLVALGNPLSWAIYWAIVRARSKQLTVDADAVAAAAAAAVVVAAGASVEEEAAAVAVAAGASVEEEAAVSTTKQYEFTHDKWDDILLFQLGYGSVCAVVATAFNVFTSAWASEAATIDAPLDWFWCALVCTLLAFPVSSLPAAVSLRAKFVRQVLFVRRCVPADVCVPVLARAELYQHVRDELHQNDGGCHRAPLRVPICLPTYLPPTPNLLTIYPKSLPEPPDNLPQYFN